MRWHGRHFLNEVSPAAGSCAKALAEDAITIALASTRLFIISLLEACIESDGGVEPMAIRRVRMNACNRGVNHQLASIAFMASRCGEKASSALIMTGMDLRLADSRAGAFCIQQVKRSGPSALASRSTAMRPVLDRRIAGRRDVGDANIVQCNVPA